jgi:hypothetical protein
MASEIYICGSRLSFREFIGFRSGVDKVPVVVGYDAELLIKCFHKIRYSVMV